MKKTTVFLVIVLLDQLIKWLVVENHLAFLGGLFYPLCNPFISWGIPLGGLIFWLMWILATALILWLSLKSGWNTLLIVVLAGATSNIIDRILRGCVVDFIKIGWFPTFNLADVAITAGILLYLLQSPELFPKTKK